MAVCVLAKGHIPGYILPEAFFNSTILCDKNKNIEKLFKIT